MLPNVRGFTDGSSVVFNVFAKYSFMYTDRPDRWSDKEKLFKVSFADIELNASSDALQCGVHTQIGFHRQQFERKWNASSQTKPQKKKKSIEWNEKVEMLGLACTHLVVQRFLVFFLEVFVQRVNIFM